MIVRFGCGFVGVDKGKGCLYNSAEVESSAKSLSNDISPPASIPNPKHLDFPPTHLHYRVLQNDQFLSSEQGLLGK